MLLSSFFVQGIPNYWFISQEMCLEAGMGSVNWLTAQSYAGLLVVDLMNEMEWCNLLSFPSSPASSALGETSLLQLEPFKMPRRAKHAGVI